jgi:colanic acid/amylovoran biosynthesis glycosyltransferase
MRRARAASPKAEGQVLFYVEGHLPPSQAFVAHQARALQRYRAEMLAGRRIESPSAALGTYPIHDISASPSMRVGELLLKLPRVAVPALFPAVQRADLVHAHFGKNGFVVWPLVRAAGKPLVTTFHGTDATFAGNPQALGGFNQVRYYAHGRKQMASWPGWSIAVSNYVRGRLLAHGFPAERVVQHYVGIDTTLFRPRDVPRHSNRVVSIARFIDCKGHREMVDALAAVVAGGRAVDFVMVGEGPLRDEIEAYARKHLPSVTILARQTQAQLVELLAGARLYLHGSVTMDTGQAEALGLTNIEAQAVGTPVVAFDTGGVAETIENGRTGIVVPEPDVKAMSAAIGTLLDDEDKWNAFSAAAIEMVPRRFDLATQTRALEEIYDEVLAHHAGTSRAGMAA